MSSISVAIPILIAFLLGSHDSAAGEVADSLSRGHSCESSADKDDTDAFVSDWFRSIAEIQLVVDRGKKALPTAAISMASEQYEIVLCARQRTSRYKSSPDQWKKAQADALDASIGRIAFNLSDQQRRTGVSPDAVFRNESEILATLTRRFIEAGGPLFADGSQSKAEANSSRTLLRLHERFCNRDLLAQFAVDPDAPLSRAACEIQMSLKQRGEE
jgi:hypothetical protein